MADELLEYRFMNLHEFVTVARQNLNRNNWDYLIGASIGCWCVATVLIESLTIGAQSPACSGQGTTRTRHVLREIKCPSNCIMEI